jgi:SAM-dependent methyltransferase
LATAEVIAQWDAYTDIGSDVEPEAPSEECLNFIAELAASGHALDLGPGTGRVAIPLAERGVPVTALDISSKVLEGMKPKIAGLPIHLVQADMADFTLPATFEVIYATWSTFFALLTQDDQVNCFRSVSQALTPTGSFVIDVFSPINDQGVLSINHVTVRDAADEHVDVTYTRHRAVSQRIRFQEVRISATGNRLAPVDIRYAWPSELDLMARLAGLRLVARYSGWDRRPFTSASYRNLSVYSAR